jgi:asparagine synthetase B (glutamine-hydrolysing)
MCGIAGFFQLSKSDSQTPEQAADDLHRITRCLIHRGPDEEGYLMPRRSISACAD